MTKYLHQNQINFIRRHYIDRDMNGARIAAALGIHKHTAYKYIAEFKEIERLHPGKLRNFRFLLPRRPRRKCAAYYDLPDIVPGLVERATGPVLEALTLWKQYRLLYPDGCSDYLFCNFLRDWLRDNKVCPYSPSRVRDIPPEDMEEFRRWRGGSDRQRWRKAVLIMGSFEQRPLAEISGQIELGIPHIRKWIRRYQAEGIARLRDRPYTPRAKDLASNKMKRENILKLLQQTPKLHGLNRTAWRLVDMARAYQTVYGEPILPETIGRHLRLMGYHFQKSRERLTSPDKLYREKMDHIKRILASLAPDEKFFSADEYGPAVVSMKTGWTITRVGEVKTIPASHKRRGHYVLTAALELSTNQVTHFYSPRKDSAEMIRLIDTLCGQYQGQRTLYLSWDCASWHTSKMVRGHLRKINAAKYRKLQGTPRVELAPLPSSAQYLNIIESVFSGMAKAVIHNSAYDSLEECKAAIDAYFAERNRHFRENPKRAGHKIWGGEIVKPEFSETNHCKSRPRIPKR